MYTIQLWAGGNSETQAMGRVAWRADDKPHPQLYHAQVAPTPVVQEKEKFKIKWHKPKGSNEFCNFVSSSKDAQRSFFSQFTSVSSKC